jgi:protein required for attachment to host cells
MSKLKVRQGDWVVVCDGAKALILENAGDEKFLNLKTRQVYEQADQKTREQGTDAPGRSINSIDSRRSAMEQTDWHAQDEERFLKEIAGLLDTEVKAGHVRGIVVVAPPRALGILRPAYTHDLKKALRTEIDKDFVKMPVHEIEKHLAA